MNQQSLERFKKACDVTIVETEEKSHLTVEAHLTNEDVINTIEYMNGLEKYELIKFLHTQENFIVGLFLLLEEVGNITKNHDMLMCVAVELFKLQLVHVLAVPCRVSKMFEENDIVQIKETLGVIPDREELEELHDLTHEQVSLLQDVLGGTQVSSESAIHTLFKN